MNVAVMRQLFRIINSSPVLTFTSQPVLPATTASSQPIALRANEDTSLVALKDTFDKLLPRLQEYVGYTPLANAAGNTAISLPMGRSNRGDPIGLQLSAPTGDERLLLELAYELEGAKPWPFLYDTVK